MTTPIQHLLRSHPRDIGGFAVRRVLPSVPKQMVGPFIFFDHMGPARLPPGEGLDVRPHPHIGLATVTYLFDGEILHRDSLGTVQPIRPGDVNWMTAGRGIAHSERTPPELRRAGAGVHGIQTWVALPRASEEVEPSFFHHPAGEPAGRRAAGRDGARDRRARVRRPLAGRGVLRHAVRRGRARAGREPPRSPEHEERGVYVVEGDVTIGDDGVEAGELVVLAEGVEVEVRAPFSATLMLLGGAKMDGPRFIWWNFVSSSKERIERAKADWREDRFGPVPGETERIPLPER